MSKFPVYLSFKETNRYFDSLKSIDDKIEYYRYILVVYEEMYSHKSIQDIEAYIEKYKFKGKIKNIKDENPLYAEDLISANDQKNDFYLETKYINLYKKLNLLWTSYSFELDNLLYYHSVTKGDFKLVFIDTDFEIAFASFKTKAEQLKWVIELSQKTYGIYKYFGDRHIALLYKKYQLMKHYPIAEIKEPFSKRRFISKKYDIFRKYLIGPLSHKLSSIEYELEIDIKVDLVLSYSSLENVPDEEKFFLWGFKFDTMNKFAEKAFPDLSNKIEYYSYALSVLFIEHSELLKDSYIQIQLPKIEYRLKHLKTKYELKKNALKILDKQIILKSDKEKTDINNPKFDFPVIKNKNKPIWLRGEQKLLVLLHKLQLKGYIEDKLDTQDWKEQYLALFINHETKKPFSNFDIKPVLWKEDVVDLACLIHELNQDGFKSCIDNYHRSKYLSNIFLYETRDTNKNNEERKIDYLNSDTLNSVISNIKNNKISRWEIAEIAHSVRQYSV